MVQNQRNSRIYAQFWLVYYWRRSRFLLSIPKGLWRHHEINHGRRSVSGQLWPIRRFSRSCSGWNERHEHETLEANIWQWEIPSLRLWICERQWSSLRDSIPTFLGLGTNPTANATDCRKLRWVGRLDGREFFMGLTKTISKDVPKSIQRRPLHFHVGHKRFALDEWRKVNAEVKHEIGVIWGKCNWEIVMKLIEDFNHNKVK